jgi:hypothetical protein
MFSLHETTRIRLCRAAFVAACLVPTCAVLAWCVAVNTAAYRRAHEEAIAAALGWQARLARASTPRPGLVLYEWLELSEPASGQLLARLPFVEITTSGGETHVRLPHPAVVNGARLDAVFKLIESRTGPGSATGSVRFDARNVTLYLPDGDQTLSDVHGRLHGGDEPSAKLSFRRAMAGIHTARPAQLTLEARQTSAGMEQSLLLASGSTPLPLSLVAPLWPGARHFGSTCQFQGRLAATRRGGRWRAEIAGALENVDLDRLVSQQFPHKLSGLAEAQLKSVVVEDGRLVSAAGALLAGPGVISRSLVQSAATHLRVQAAAEVLRGRGNVLEYSRLGAGFELSAQGLALRGQLSESQGALVVDDRRALALEPPVVSQPVLGLVRMLVPHSEVHVPATRETVELTGRLPLPSVLPPPGTEQALPRVRQVRVAPPSTARTR